MTSQDRRWRLMLELFASIAAQSDVESIARELDARIANLASCEFLCMMLHDDTRQTVRLRYIDSDRRNCVERTEFAVDQSPSSLVWKTQTPLVISTASATDYGGQVTEFFNSMRLSACCLLPLTTAHRRLGALAFGRRDDTIFTDENIGVLRQIANQVAIAVDNVLTHREAIAYREKMQRERDRLHLLLDVNNQIAPNLELRELLRSIAANIRRVMHCDAVGVLLHDWKLNALRGYALDFPGCKGFVQDGMLIPIDSSMSGHVVNSGVAWSGKTEDIPRCLPSFNKAQAEGLKYIALVPMTCQSRVLGVLGLARIAETPFVQDDIDLLNQVARQIAIAVDNALEYRDLVDERARLVEEKLYLNEEIRTQHNFEEIVGESAALKEILSQVETVAPTDSNVLILGDTGTGKELIARAIHNLSGRRDRTFVRINCAAIPLGLLESELFGHERGAFTGAIAQKIGRFELADKGSLFLDEIGDIPLELQAKLLRVLQEQEFERLGNSKTLKVNVRIIAATNADLSQLVAAKQFRSDLYYRINVFPLRVPSLRDRAEDIPALVRYFAQKYSRSMRKQIRSIPAAAMTALGRYSWPGNIRELENFIERGVILSTGSELNLPIAELTSAPVADPNGPIKLADAERDHIMRTLKSTQWIVGGPKGAAACLGMKRTTLQARIRKLGISRPL
jgi:formate hydrogenlyase transcriptional activator